MSNPSKLSKWTPTTDLMTLRRMGKLCEELGELQAVAARVVIQGIDETDPGTGKVNRVRLLDELADVQAQIGCTLLAFDLDQAYLQRRVADKMRQMQEWELHARALRENATLKQALRELHDAIEEVKSASTALEGRKAWARVDAASAQAAALAAGVTAVPEDDAPRVPHPAEQLHEAVLAIVGELMHGDPAADSREGRLLVKLAGAVEAYERVVYPMPASGVTPSDGGQQ